MASLIIFSIFVFIMIYVRKSNERYISKSKNVLEVAQNPITTLFRVSKDFAKNYGLICNTDAKSNTCSFNAKESKSDLLTVEFTELDGLIYAKMNFLLITGINIKEHFIIKEQITADILSESMPERYKIKLGKKELYVNMECGFTSSEPYLQESYLIILGNLFFSCWNLVLSYSSRIEELKKVGMN